MLSAKYFNPDVPIGTSKRYVHEDCPKVHKGSAPGKALVVTRTVEGYSWYCHRCHEFGKRGTDDLSPAETIRWIKSINLKPKTYRKEVKLPEDFTNDMPASALAYLWSRGIEDEDIKRFNFGYSLHLNYLIFPIYEDQELIYYQGRNLGQTTKEAPKYINQRQLGRKDIFFRVNREGSNKLIIVEDIVSSIRVSKFGSSIGLLSSFIPDTLIFDLAIKKKYDRINIWLDHDKRKKVFDWMFRYRSFGINVFQIDTFRDPKFHSDFELREILCQK